MNTLFSQVIGTLVHKLRKPTVARLRTLYRPIALLLGLWLVLGGNAVQADVNPDGSFTHVLPIKIPPGTNGMEPELSLKYSSNGINGMIGLGWTLEGLPTITRIDNGNGIHYQGNDTYDSPDKRLVDISGNKTMYQGTEGSWNKYEPIYQGCSAPSGEPCAWVVHAVDGNKLYYGFTGDSRIEAIDRDNAVRVWALNKVEDVYGNSYEVQYMEDFSNGDFYPFRVTYTKGHTLSVFRTVEFLYESRSDNVLKFTENAKVEMDQRLKWIVISGGGQLIRKYEFTYRSGTGVSQLETVQEYGSDGLSTLPPVKFTWRGTQGGFDSPTQWIIPNRWQRGEHVYPTDAHNGCHGSGGHLCTYSDFRDMNGDGLPDRVMHWVNGTEGIWVAMNNGSGYDEPTQWMTYSQWGYNPHATVSFGSTSGNVYNDIYDVTGDGLPDKTMHTVNGNSGFWVAVNTGSGFQDPVEWLEHNAWQAGSLNLKTHKDGTFTYKDMIDMNGDGLVDKVIDGANGQTGMWVALNNGSGFENPVKWLQYQQWGYEHHHKIRHFDGGNTYGDLQDMNGDGLPDKVMHYALGQHGFWVALNTGQGFAFPKMWNAHNAWGETWHDRVMHQGSGYTHSTLKDMNGDSLPDRVTNRANGEYGLWVAINTGSGFQDPVMWLRDNQWQNGNSRHPSYMTSGRTYVDLFDMNKDGLPDRTMNSAFGKNGFWVALNNGSGFETPVEWMKDQEWKNGDHNYLRYVANYDTYHTLRDMNGDGYPDRIMYHAFATQALWVALNQPGNAIITRVDNGLGGQTVVEYTPAAQVSGAIESEISTCGNGTGDICGSASVNSKQLVTRITISGGRFTNTPQGQIYDRSLRYDYYNGRRATGFLTEEEDLGFEWRKIIDEQTNTTIQTFYRQDKPFHQRELKVTKIDSSGNTVSEVEFGYTSSQPYTGITRVTKSSETHRNYHAGAETSARTITYTHDAYGFITSQTDCMATDCVATTSEYDHDLINWRFGAVKDVKTMADTTILDWLKYTYLGPNLVRQRSFLCQDSTQCTSESDGQFIIMSQNQEYDEHGNLLVELDVSNRLTTYTYDDRYKTYVTSKKNNLGMETRTTYNDAGLVLTVTDFNDNTTVNTHDAFGRLIRVENPEGGLQEFEYNEYGNPLQQHNLLRVLEDTQVWWEKNYFDGMGKPYRTERKGDAGDTIVIETQTYYHNGSKIVKTTQPYYEGEAVLWKEIRYDDQNRVSLITNPDGTRASYTYGSNQVSVDKEGQITVSYTNGRKQLTRRTDSENGDLHYEYDPAGRMIRATLPNSQVYAIAFDSWGRKLRVDDPALGTKAYTYDTYGNILTASHGLANTITYEYDVLNRLVRVATTNNTVEYTYDDNAIANGQGRLTKVVDSSGTTDLAYNKLGKLATKSVSLNSLPGVQVTQFEYDLRGRHIRTLWQDDTVQEITYTASGYVNQVKLDGIVYGTFSNYTPTGKIGKYITNTGVSGYEVTTNYTYNLSDRLRTAMTTQNSGTVLRDLFYSHDANGNISAIIDNRIDTIVDAVDTDETQFFQYDDLNRLVEADGVYGIKRYSYDSIGNMTEMGGLKNMQFSYDTRQQIATIAEVATTGTAMAVTYDDRGNTTSKTIDGVTWDYTYDDFSRLVNVKKDTVPVVDLSYNYKNQRTKKVYYAPEGHTITTHYMDNYEIRQDSSQSHHTVTKHIQAGGFGKVASITQQINGTAAIAAAVGSQYHKYAGLFDTGSVAGLTQMASAHLTGSTLQARVAFHAFTTPENVSLVLRWMLVFSISGTLVFFVLWVRTFWKHAKQPLYGNWLRPTALGFTMIFFVISCGAGGGAGGGGASASGPVTATEVASFPGAVPPEYDPETEVPFFGRLERVLGSTTSGPPVGTWFYHPNHIGSASLITDGQGNEATRILYLPYGEIDDDHSTGSNNVTHKFTGQELDEETGLLYFRSRFYDPSLGRFLTPDVIIPGDGLRSQGFNRYSYVEGNPILYNDPTGHKRCRGSWFSKKLCRARKAADRARKRIEEALRRAREAARRAAEAARRAAEEAARRAAEAARRAAQEAARRAAEAARRAAEAAAKAAQKAAQDAADEARRSSERLVKTTQTNIAGLRREIGKETRNLAHEITKESRGLANEFNKAAPNSVLSNAVEWHADTIERNERQVAAELEAGIYAAIDVYTFGAGSIVIQNTHDPNDDVETGTQNGNGRFIDTATGAYSKGTAVWNYLQ